MHKWLNIRMQSYQRENRLIAFALQQIASLFSSLLGHQLPQVLLDSLSNRSGLILLLFQVLLRYFGQPSLAVNWIYFCDWLCCCSDSKHSLLGHFLLLVKVTSSGEGCFVCFRRSLLLYYRWKPSLTELHYYPLVSWWWESLGQENNLLHCFYFYWWSYLTLSGPMLSYKGLSRIYHMFLR